MSTSNTSERGSGVNCCHGSVLVWPCFVCNRQNLPVCCRVSAASLTKAVQEEIHQVLQGAASRCTPALHTSCAGLLLPPAASLWSSGLRPCRLLSPLSRRQHCNSLFIDVTSPWIDGRARCCAGRGGRSTNAVVVAFNDGELSPTTAQHAIATKDIFHSMCCRPLRAVGGTGSKVFRYCRHPRLTSVCSR